MTRIDLRTCIHGVVMINKNDNVMLTSERSNKNIALCTPYALMAQLSHGMVASVGPGVIKMAGKAISPLKMNIPSQIGPNDLIIGIRDMKAKESTHSATAATTQTWRAVAAVIIRPSMLTNLTRGSRRCKRPRCSDRCSAYKERSSVSVSASMVR